MRLTEKERRSKSISRFTTTGALVGAALGLALRRVGGRCLSASAHAGFLLLSLVPFALHARHIVFHSMQYGPPGQPAAGMYPDLRLFATVVGALMLVLLALSVWMALRGGKPQGALLSALLPAAAFCGYFFCLRLVNLDPPHGPIPIDNVPVIWLFAVSAGATVFLASYGWMRLEKPHVSS